jgi:hypothetical protein
MPRLVLFFFGSKKSHIMKTFLSQKRGVLQAFLTKEALNQIANTTVQVFRAVHTHAQIHVSHDSCIVISLAQRSPSCLTGVFYHDDLASFITKNKMECHTHTN